MPLRRLCLPLASFVLLAAPAAALAAGYTVPGVLVAPAKVDVPAPPHAGFLPAIENPILELRSFDPLPECFIFLEGGPGTPVADAATPSKNAVIWQLGSHSFTPGVFPVLAGAAVEISNGGKETHFLFSPDQPELVSKDAIAPSGSRTLTAPAAGTVITVRSRNIPHLEGRIVVVPTRYYARVDRLGRFKIDNLPAGRYTAKVWFRGGWTRIEKAFDVPAKELRLELTAADLSERPITAPPTETPGK